MAGDAHFFPHLRNAKSALAIVHDQVSKSLFGADFPSESNRLGWPPRGGSGKAVIYGYVGFSYDCNIAVEDKSPSVLELTADEADFDGHIVVFRAQQLQGGEKDFANEVANNRKAILAAESLLDSRCPPDNTTT